MPPPAPYPGTPSHLKPQPFPLAQAFASPAKLAEMVSRVNEALAGPLPAAVQRMRLYLPNPGTHAILFKPVKSNLVEAHSQVWEREGRAGFWEEPNVSADQD